MHLLALVTPRKPRLFTLLAACVAVALVCLGSASQPAQAGQDFGAEYEGYSTDGSTVHVLIGAAVVQIQIDLGHGIEPVASVCPVGVAIADVPLDNGAFRVDRKIYVDEHQTVSIVGFFDMPFFDAVGGTLRIEPDPGQPCKARTAVWRASRSAGGMAAPRNGLGTVIVTTGTVYRGATDTPAGTVRIRTNDIGSGIEQLSISARDGNCTYERTLNTPFVRYDVGVSMDYTDTSQTRPWRVVVVGSTLTVRGGAILGGVGSCQTLPVYFVADQATPPVATPTPIQVTTTSPPPTVIATPRFTTGTFPRSGTSIAVFGGGTNAELVTASSCPGTTAVFFATNPAGQFVTFVPVATVASVNASWNALFPNGIPTNTPIVGRCS